MLRHGGLDGIQQDIAHQRYAASQRDAEQGSNRPQEAAQDPEEPLEQSPYDLEGQQDEKTENVTEELVLYMFLGVFVIFVVDSFARAGKYTR